MTRWKLFMAVATAATVAGCATGGDGSQASYDAKRPPAGVAKTATAVTAAQVTGSWQCRELNPAPGREPQTTAMRFNGDGTGLNTSTVDTQTMAPEGGGLPGRYNVSFGYRWTVERDRIMATNVETKVESADGGQFSGMMAGLSQFVINNFATGSKPGEMEVVEIGPRRMVLRPTVLENPPVTACTRG